MAFTLHPTHAPTVAHPATPFAFPPNPTDPPSPKAHSPSHTLSIAVYPAHSPAASLPQGGTPDPRSTCRSPVHLQIRVPRRCSTSPPSFSVETQSEFGAP
jgi:hypothetical protein